MASAHQVREWLEVANSFLPEAGYAMGVVVFVYLAREGWRSRKDWEFGPPWSRLTHYVKQLHEQFGHLQRLGLGERVGFHIMSVQPGNSRKFDPAEAHEIESLVNLAIHEQRAIIVAGTANTGKSTFLQALAIRTSNTDYSRKLGFRKRRVPIYVHANHLDPDLSFERAVQKALSLQHFTSSPKCIGRAIRAGRAMILIDGLSEIASRNARHRLCNWLDQYFSANPDHLPFLLSCRPDVLLPGPLLRLPSYTAAIKNYALQNFRPLAAVSESRMPAVFRHGVEQNSEYIRIAPPTMPLVLAGARKPAPTAHYHLAKYPVTNRLYRIFVEATGHRPPAFWKEFGFADDDLPVVGVDWEDAESYCAWLTQMTGTANALGAFSFQLPTEEEWEWAASGGSRRFPWGDEAPEARHANFLSGQCRLTAVSAHPDGATPKGLMDMAGNAWEWTATIVQNNSAKRVVKGGGAFNEAEWISCITRDYHPKRVSRFVGFRVARIPVDE